MIIFAKETFTVDCSRTVGSPDFGRTPLKPAVKGQYKFLIVTNLSCAFMEKNAKTSIISVFLVHLLRLVWSIFT